MNTEHVARVVKRARSLRLVAVYENGQIHFTAANPVDSSAPPYFTGDTLAECLAFMQGWASHEFDTALRNIAHEIHARRGSQERAS